MEERVKEILKEALQALDDVPMDKLLEQRYSRLMSFGNYES